ncbi:30S ribosome-binding factor RbfA [bacterium]|nr:30S ribosome-binding factor RbfA [bacterium]
MRWHKRRDRGPSRRLEQVASVIAEKVSEIIRTEVDDPRVAEMVSITYVKVSPDLRDATVYFSIIGTEQEWKDTEEGLNKAKGFIQKLLGERIFLKVTPRLRFVPDHTMERAQKIEQLIEENIKTNEA